MFARSRGRHRELSVHRIRQNHINDLHLRIVLNAAKGFVVINRFGLDAVLLRKPLRFCRITANQGGQLCFLADAKCGNQLVDRQSAEADKREADPFFQGPGLDGISRLWSGSIAPSLFLGRDELCELRSE